jgi:hypothetical protein
MVTWHAQVPASTTTARGIEEESSAAGHLEIEFQGVKLSCKLM